MKVPIGGPFRITPMMKENLDIILSPTLERNRLSPGPFVNEFEYQFANYHHAQHAIMTNSGTSALVVALQALKEIEGWADGDEVICPAITFVATINAVIHCNLTPVLVDVEPTTYTLDPDLVERAITSRTRCIIPVHVFGLSAEMTPLLKLAADHDLKIIEDACEAAGATYNGSYVGAIGDVGCFSFYMSHHIVSGVGGMAITGNPWYAKKIRSLVNHGWDRERAPMDSDYDFEEIKHRYYFTSIGHSFRATELEAAIALPQLHTLKETIKRRQENAKFLTRGLSLSVDKLQLPCCPYDRSHAYMMYPIVLRNDNKWSLIQHLEEQGIETREMLPLTNQPCYQSRFNEADYPIARWINKQGFYIGCSEHLTPGQLSHVIGVLNGYFDK